MGRYSVSAGGRLRAASARRVVLAGAALFVALVYAAPAIAGYVFYYRVFGAWSVTCWTDMASKRKACSLSAPPPELQDTIPRSQAPSVVTVMETARGAFAVTARLPGVLAPNSPVFLRVGETKPYGVLPDARGIAAWQGAQAAGILAGLKSGEPIALRSYPLGAKGPRGEVLSAEGFAEAFATYRRQLRAHGIIAGGGE